MAITTNEMEAGRRAWAAMRHTPGLLARVFEEAAPMPAAVAVDMVQDVTGDREPAILAICAAAADELDAAKPNSHLPSAIAEHWVHEVTNKLRVADVVIADDNAKHIIGVTAFPDRLVGSLTAWNEWRLWALEARRAIELCRQARREWPAGGDEIPF